MRLQHCYRLFYLQDTKQGFSAAAPEETPQKGHDLTCVIKDAWSSHTLLLT